MKTALGKAKGLGAAKGGTHHWWVQKATSVALFPLTIWFIASMATLAGADYEAVILWIKNPLVTVLLLMFLSFVFYHLRIGVQVILEDYAHTNFWRITLYFINDAFCLIFGLLAIVSVLKIFFGS